VKALFWTYWLVLATGIVLYAVVGATHQ